jgi:hypothetical protein
MTPLAKLERTTVANKEHWLSKMLPLGRSQIEIAYRRTFTAQEVENLRAGLWPLDMEDRWVIHLGTSSLDMWRSWTGHCIYSLPRHAEGNGAALGPLLVNGDKRIYRSPGASQDIRACEALIDRVLGL